MAKDVRGIEIKVGQQVARAKKLGQMDGLYVEVAEVTHVDGDKVYLDGSKRALNFPDRIAVLGPVA